MVRRRKRPRGMPRTIHVNPVDALCLSGLSVLASLALGASPDKALDYGIQTLKLFGAKIEIEPSEPKEEDFMLGLA